MKNIKVTYETINRSKQLSNIFNIAVNPKYTEEKYYGTCDINFKNVPDDVARLFLEEIEDYQGNPGWITKVLIEDVNEEKYGFDAH